MENQADETLISNNQNGNIIQELPLEPKIEGKIKPRAIIFKAREKELDKIKELIEIQFPEVKILYITSGPPSSILRVVKSTPWENKTPV